MNNKPVAWMNSKGDIILPAHQANKEYNIPLYTHPVKEQDTDCQYCKQGCIRCDARKQLTDEEITQVFDECYPNNADGDVVTLVDFARAILRKAQNERKCTNAK